MKKGFYFLLIVFAAMWTVSCDKTKSYTDMLKAQEKAIERLKRDSGFVFLSEFPKDSVFKSNEFVELDNGVYLNIIDKGNNERAELYSTVISTRFIARMFMGSDTGTVDLLGPHSNGTYPVKFKYGQYAIDPNEYYLYDMFISPGLAAGLPYVGDSAYVKLIVPFKQMMDLGAVSFQSSGIPVFFQKVRYIFIK